MRLASSLPVSVCAVTGLLILLGHDLRHRLRDCNEIVYRLKCIHSDTLSRIDREILPFYCSSAILLFLQR